MKTVTYLGPHEAVFIPLESGMSYECDRDGTVELPNQLADELIERGDWKLAEKTSKKTTKSDKDEE